MIYRPKNTPSQHNNSPLLPRQRDQQKSPQGRTIATDFSEIRVWRSKTPPTTVTASDPTDLPTPPPRPLERNLDATDFHHGQLPTAQEVLNEINEATLRYTNVDDPIERAARLQRVLQSEIDGSVEQTVERIIQHSAASLGIPVDSILQPQPLSEAAQEVVETSQETTAPKRRGRPPRARATRTIQLSPRVFVGTSLRRRNLTQVGMSPGTSKQAVPRTAGSSSQDPKAQNTSGTGEKSGAPANKRPRLDFPEDRPPLP